MIIISYIVWGKTSVLFRQPKYQAWSSILSTLELRAMQTSNSFYFKNRTIQDNLGHWSNLLSIISDI